MLPAVFSARCGLAATLEFWPVLTPQAELAGNTSNSYSGTRVLGCDVS